MEADRELVSPTGIEAGARLREVRQKQGLTLQRVEQLSMQIATALNNPEFGIPPSRLSHIETKGVVPSIYRLHSLARIYRLNPDSILEWYGVRITALDSLQMDESPAGRFAFFRIPPKVEVPVALDPSFDPRVTAEIGRIIEAWGEVPFSFLSRFRTREFIYGYVGMEDAMMAPLLSPGAFVQIDPSRRSVRKGGWRNEYERPIYAIDSRSGLYFCWCSIADRRLILQPHPLSRQDVKIFSGDEVEIVGQVVGFATRVNVAVSETLTVPERR